MPALVPAGFTRGAIVFLGPATSARAQERLLQHFWDDAGAYGSRVLIVDCARGDQLVTARMAAILKSWEGESVETLALPDRSQAMDAAVAEQVARATGILITGDDPLRLAGLLGGTPLAQAVRRANAQSKVVCGVGGAATLLCQHMTIASNTNSAGPLVHRNRVQFAPGLGVINRVLLDATSNDPERQAFSLGRLLSAVAYNPFLVGMHLQADTGAVVYPNSVLEVFGDRSALLVDGMRLQHNGLSDAGDDQAASLLGVQLHVLGPGCSFNLDTREVTAPAEGEMTLRSEAVKAAF